MRLEGRPHRHVPAADPTALQLHCTPLYARGSTVTTPLQRPGMPPAIFPRPSESVRVSRVPRATLEAVMTSLAPFLMLTVGLVVGLAMLSIFDTLVREAPTRTEAPAADGGCEPP